MNKAHPLTSPMIVRLLDVKKDHFRPPKESGEFLGSKVPYLNTFDALTYLTNYTRSDITFSVNLLVRYSSAQTQMHWNRIKPISLKFFYTNKLQKKTDVDIQQIRSSDNLIDLFTKAFPTSTFNKLVHKIRMCYFRDVTC